MSPQATTLAAKPASEVIVDAYVDALLGMPVAQPPQGDATAPVQAPEPAADTEPASTTEPVAPEAVDPEPEPAPQAMDEAASEPDGERDAGEPDDASEPVPAPPVAVDPSLVLELLAEFERETQPAVAAQPTARETAKDQPVPEPAAAQVRPPVPESHDAPASFRLVDMAAGTQAPAAPVGQRWLRVSVGEDRYAVELLRVQEVVRLAPVIAVRGAAPSLLGVMNLRGRVVPVHDLGRWLRRAPVQSDERSRIVVLEFKDELVGLLVTAVTDVVTLDAPQIEPPTPGLRDRIGMGIARTPGAPPTVLLDARVVFD
ncbi:chemotaxis protein CheW [Thermomonas brevis]